MICELCDEEMVYSSTEYFWICFSCDLEVSSRMVPKKYNFPIDINEDDKNTVIFYYDNFWKHKQ